MDKSKTDYHLQCFIDTFRDHRDNIRLLGIPGLDVSASIYKRILYVCFLDALSKSVPCDKKDRFAWFVEEFCDWEDSRRVSLPELLKVLQKNNHPGVFKQLREWAESEVVKTRQREIGNDPIFDKFVKHWPKDNSNKPVLLSNPMGNQPSGLKPERFKHSHLLYGERNTLAHEFRSRFGKYDGSYEDEPVYVPEFDDLITQKTQPESELKLLYPERFLKGLCENAFCKVKSYFDENDVDPIETIESNSRSYLVR